MFMHAFSQAGWDISPFEPLGAPPGFVSGFRPLSTSFCRAGRVLESSFGVNPSVEGNTQIRITSPKLPLGEACWANATEAIESPEPRVGPRPSNFGPFLPEVAIPPLIGPSGSPLDEGTLFGETQYYTALQTGQPPSE